MQLRSGDRINHYTLLEPLGEGGQGSVWKIVDPRDGGVVRALKLVSLAETGPAAFDRARREAQILAGARHPALVRCHGLFEEPSDGIVGLVMDLVAGGSLADAVEAGRIDRKLGVAVLAQVADALAYVHGAGLVHRDLKPENVLLTEGFWEEPNRSGTVKLVDFGIAATAGNPTQITAPGVVIGTLPYLAPELVDPATWGREQGPARDVFAFGVLACRVLLEKHPTGLGFDAAMIDYARAYKAAEAGRIAWPPVGLTGGWGAVVGACLALRPAERPADGRALLEMLGERGAPTPASMPTSPHRGPMGGSTVRTEPMPSPPPGAARTIRAAPVSAAVSRRAPPRRERIRTVLLVLAGALAGGACVAYFSRSSPEERPPPLPAAPVPVVTQGRDEGALSPCRDPGRGFDPSATRFECPICQRQARFLSADDGWRLRLGAPSPDVPGGRLWAQVSGQSAIRTGGADRLSVTTADIIGKRVYFSVRDAGGSVMTDAFGRKIKGFGQIRDGSSRIKETALCAGLILQIEGTDTLVTVYLDPP